MRNEHPVWHSPQVARPALRGVAHADLCVVGLGGSGLAAIRAARAAGMSVIGIDAAQVAAGAAGRNGGFLLAGPAWFHHDARDRVGRDLAAQMYAATLDELRSMATEPTVRCVGSLRIAANDDEHSDIEQHYAALREDGFTAERYEGREGLGMRVSSDAVFDPFAHCVWQAAQLDKDGARLFENSPALDIDVGRVRTPLGVVCAPLVLVAVDGSLEALVPSLARRVATWRLQMLATAPLRETLSAHAVYSRFGYDYWQQRPNGSIALGGGRDVGGADERDGDLRTTTVVQAHLLEVLRGLVGPDVAVTHQWAGRVGYTDDGMPVCEQFQEGGVAIGGYCGTGNIIGRILGREAVQRWAGGASPYIDALSAARSRADAS